MLEWQGALNLLDWDVDLLLEKDEDEPDAQATVDMELHERTATVRIKPRQPDPELLVVHELLHLTIAVAKSSKTGEEWAVESLSKALLELKRKANQKGEQQ